MRHLGAIAFLTVATWAVFAHSAAAPESSLRPTARPIIADVERAVVLAALAPTPRPILAAAPVTPQPATVIRSTTVAPLVAVKYFAPPELRPKARPANLESLHKAMAKKPSKGPAGKYGEICGSDDIRGQRIDPVPGRIRGCGIPDAVRVYYVSGVKLSVPSRMDCTTAKALNSWVGKSAIPAFQKLGGLKELKVAAGYACRTRNNQSGGKISEHGKGRAIDISAFNLANGQSVTVLKGWNQRKYSKAMRKVHKDACAPFGTVLGPNADRFHRDHFHFDTARYRSGSYCR